MSRGRPNWLLLGLLTISVATHVLILANMRGLFHHRHTDYIELEVRSKQPGIRTDIPVPPRHKKPHKVISESAIKSVRPVFIPNVIDPGKIPKLDPVPSPLTEPGVPESPNIQVPRVFFICTAGRSRKRRAHTTDWACIWVFGVRLPGTIRMLIEQHKKYPMAAVRDASPFPPPPSGLFNGPVPLEITIIYELM